MLPSQSFSSQAQIRSTKTAFLSLVDAMLYLQRARELERKKEGAKELAEKRLIALETFKVELSDGITKLNDVLGELRTNELSKQVGGFASTAVDQMKQKLNQEAQKQLLTFDSDSSSERTKTVKSLEAFLSTSPLPIIDYTIEIKLQDGAYSSKARYRCQDNIEYEFSLDTRLNTFFKSQCRIGMFDKTLRIPVALGKSWLKKEPVPDFRSLDNYVVTSAEATETSLMMECSDQENGAKTKLVYTKRGDHTSLSVAYLQGGNEVDITSEPGLNVYLNSDSFVRLMERLWLSMNELERRKIGITKIICDNISILENLDCEKFFMKSWQEISEPIKEMMKLSDEKRDQKDEFLDKTTVREKLKVLGSEAAGIAKLLGMQLDD